MAQSVAPRNQLGCGDVTEQLARIPDDSVHVVVTSPPYWSQRDYDVPNEIGDEDTLTEYVGVMGDVARELQRVVHPRGSVFLNVGDVYRNKCLQQLPHHVARKFIDVGWTYRRDIIWDKGTTRKPDPSRDRRATAHEYVFHFTHDGEYFYNETVADGSHDSVIEAPTASVSAPHLAPFSEELVEQCLKGATPENVCRSCGCPYEREYESIPRPLAEPEREQSKRARELYEDSTLTEDHLNAIRSVGISDVGKATVTENGGEGNTEEIVRKAMRAKDVLGGYYREFTMTERQPSGWTPACDCGDDPAPPLVLDPFVGSGTTAVVAKRMGYDYIGIDIDENAIEIARNRLSEINI